MYWLNIYLKYNIRFIATFKLLFNNYKLYKVYIKVHLNGKQYLLKYNLFVNEL